MKRFFPSAGIVLVISLLVSAIWLSPAEAALIGPLGRIETSGMGVPATLDVDAGGNLYVADARNGNVYKFNRYGQLTATFALQGSGLGLAVTPDGSRLYVARKQQVVIANAVTGEVIGSLSGNEVGGGAEFVKTGEVDLDSAGNVYVADIGVTQLYIKIYNASGAYMARFGGRAAAGGEIGKFTVISSMTVDDQDNVVVTDQTPASLGGKVQVFKLTASKLGVDSVAAYANNSVANFGTPELFVPRGTTFDDQGRGYLLEYQQKHIVVVSSTFGFVERYIEPAPAVGLLDNVNDIIFEPSTQRLFVSCDGGRVEIFGVDGAQNPPVVSNHAPGVPVQQSPVGSSVVATLTPTLAFTATDEDNDPLTFAVSVMQGGAPVYEVSTTATSVVVPAGTLSENGSYQWTVQATDSKGASSAPTSAASFVVNTVNEAPSTPALLAPLNGEALAGEGVLSWQAAADPDPSDTVIGYRVEVAADDAFASPLMTAQTSGTTIALTDFADYAALVDATPYFWRVTALDAGQAASPAGAAGRFVYDTVVLRVTANVPGSKVYLGGNHGFAGRLAGEAPVVLRDPVTGPLSVVVERAGFEPFVTSVNVSGEADVDVYAKLLPARKPGGFKLISQGVNGLAGLTVGGAAAPCLVDFNNDGQLDLLVGDAAGQLQLFPSMVVSVKNELSFQPGVSLALPVLPGAVPAVVDWDNDGRKDLLVGQLDGTVRLFVNSGTESAPAFGTGQDLLIKGTAASFGAAAAPAVVDFNNDGKKDLVVGNGAGQVVVCRNLGTDAEPQLTDPAPLVQLAGAAVPSAVDWDADGNRDLLVAAGGKAYVYLWANGVYKSAGALTASGFAAVSPVDVNGAYGKDLLVGKADGRIEYWNGWSNSFVLTFKPALLEKVDELSELVAEQAPALLAQVTTIRSQIQAGSLTAAKASSQALAGQLPVGSAKVSADELAVLCGG